MKNVSTWSKPKLYFIVFCDELCKLKQSHKNLIRFHHWQTSSLSKNLVTYTPSTEIPESEVVFEIGDGMS